MQHFNTRKAIGLLLAVACSIGGMQSAFAVGTASGTTITNTATVNYQVNTNARSASGSVNFVVDNRVDLTVVNTNAGNNVNVAPGSTNQILDFTVTNTGNTTQGYLLSVAVPTANIPMANIRIYIDANNNGVPDVGELYTPGTDAGDLNPNGTVGISDTMHVLVVADTPASATNGSIDDIRLIAQTTNAGTATPTVASTAPTAGVDVVFADGAGTSSDAARDGEYSAAATYTVVSAALSVTKTILSTTDEFGTGYSLPGAKVNYQVRVTNSGSTTVDNNTVVVTDPVPANTKLCVSATCGGTPTFVDGATTSGLTAAAFQYSTVAAPNECAAASFTGYTPTADATGADPTVTCIREAPTGSMNGSNAYFDVRYFVVIK